MDWLTRMNKALDYIEANLDGDIDYKTLGQIAACSAGLFQRVFVNLTGVALSEYIRRRKLTVAAFELQSTDCRVIDIAVKFGYDSADAFTVAFKRMHGVTPAGARRPGVVLKSYQRLTFTISIKGVVEMNYRVEEKEAFTAVGKVITASQKNNPIPKFWGTCNKDGTSAKLCEIGKGKPLLGICYDMRPDETFSYMVGIEAEPADSGSFETVNVPKSTWLIFESIGPMPDAILDVWKRVWSEFMPQSIYKHAGTPDMEVYYDGDNSAADYRCEVWIPVVKK